MVDLTTDFAYAWEQTGATGTLKQTPLDFRVDETLGYAFSGSGEHLCVQVEKTGCNTAWVAARLADFLGTQPNDVSYAGRKDRHAVCRQWFSVYAPGNSEISAAAMSIDGVRFLAETRHQRKIRRGDVLRNSFILRLCEVEGELGPRLDLVGEHGFPNYFGGQRFGRENLQRADELLRERRRFSRNRDMYLSAARGYLFNRYLSATLAARGWMDIGIDETGPLYGRSRDPQPMEEAFCDVLKDWIAGLRRLKMKVASRPLRVVPESFSWERVGSDYELRFALPSGSYATSLLREVLQFSEPDRTSQAGDGNQENNNE